MKIKPINLEKYNTKVLQGVVISAGKMSKTCIVRIDRRVRDHLYRKTINKISKLHVHDEIQECQLGDKVEIKESRPISKTKSWCLLRIIEKAVIEKLA